MSWTSWKTALKGAAHQASTAAKDSIAQVTGGAKVLRDYTVGAGQVATGGTGGLWKIHDARSKKDGTPSVLVSVWVLEKKHPANMRDTQLTWDAVLELCRKDLAQLGKLKHPGIVKLVEPFEETRTQMVIVTERVFASLANVLTDFAGLPREVQRMNEDIQMSDLERKHGLLQVADTLQFLRGDCNLVHRAISPESIIVVGGAWKLASMGWSMLAEFSADSTTNVHVFNYDASDSESKRLLVPPLNYVAPELIAGTRATGALTSATDTYSFAVVAFEVLARKPFMAPRSTPSEVAGRLAGLNFMDMPEIDLQLQPVLKAMLSTNISQRPPISSFTGASYFQEDTLVRALRFMDTLLQRDNLQKAAFLKDLTSFWTRFDSRILCYKVLPALLEELRNEAVQALALPLVLRIIAQQPPKDFMDVTLPALLPVATTVKGEALALFTAGAILLAPSLPPEAVGSLVVPLLARAADHGDSRAQEEMLKAVPALAELGSLSKDELAIELLPRVCGVCLATTSAPVRTAAVQAMGRLVKLVDDEQAAKMLATCQQVTVVDKTPGTVMCVLGLGGAVAKRWGPELAATNVLPVLTPLLVAPALTQQQFNTAMRAVREMLSSVEAFRGSSSNAQQSEARPSVSAASGVPTHDFGSDFGTSAAAPRPAVSQTGPPGPVTGPSHDPFNMLGMPAPAQRPMQSDTGFADFVGASTASRPAHTGHDSLI